MCWIRVCVIEARPIELRPVEWMRHCTDELARAIPRQLRIRVERDDVLNVQQRFRVADDQRKSVTRMTSQQYIQVLELASLALTAHPRALLRIPAARTMQQIENVSGASLSTP